MKVLIVGDSFAADWSVKHINSVGWPNLLANDFVIENRAQAGASQYKILKQLQAAEVESFDCLIISHTSPDRLVTRRHPVHAHDVLHANSDLIFSDIEYHAKRFHKRFDRSLACAYDFFLYHYDEEFVGFVYTVAAEKILQIANTKPCIHLISPFANRELLPPLTGVQVIEIAVDLVEPNQPNHLTLLGNHRLYKQIKEYLHAAQSM